MKLPVDTSNVMLIAGGPAEKEVDFKTGEARVDKATGAMLYTVRLVLLSDDGIPEVLKIRVVGDEPKGLTKGLPVRVVGLTVSDWEIDGKHGLSFRAESIVLVQAKAAA